ncbi:MBL fold metallo-hydrolase [Wenjunlia tyrosinilytica]|uniref:MBL fold hydrolase n=1 Tax=Wenjunlia tyrosinilytica TaxID=1544741 RepID=A0A917ZBY8_9ACTN|nr:MBL fold metallo-hydrolase [Wenjunlia tyrosinilytica]GGO80290.1 MBL fold hydrolase [Wenjunlia tyrosinilytica]
MRVTDHGGGVWSIPVPIPDNPLGHTLVHLLDTGRGPVLIDTGWDDPDSYAVLERGLAEAGTSAAEIHGVIITHHHPDHHGLSGAVREASGAWIAMHPADADVVRRTREVGPGTWIRYVIERLEEDGAPDEHVAPLRAVRDSGRSRRASGARAALPDREISPGELVDLAGRRLRAVWTPGHTPGHVCLHLEEEVGGDPRGRLFSGDHLLPEITPHVGLYEDPEDGTVTDPLGDYLDSLERIARLNPAQVLPAHQYAFEDAGRRVRELLDHHAARLADLLRLITEAPRTPWQLAEAMEWNRPWDQIPYRSRNIAVSETSAHLRRLVKAGLAEAAPGTSPVAYRAV